MCVVVMKEDKKNYRGERLQPVKYRDYHNLSNQQTPLENNKVLNAWSIFFRFVSGIAGNSKVTCRCNEPVKR